MRGPATPIKDATAGAQGGRAGATAAAFATPSQSLCLYIIIVLLSTVAIANPLILSVFIKMSTTRFVYIMVFDIVALAIVFFSFRYRSQGGRHHLAAVVGLAVAWPAVMIGAELVMVALHEAYVKAAEPPAAPRKSVMGDSVHASDPLLAWVPRPGARTRHVSAGNFDITYVIDAKGRRAIPSNPGARRTLHFFGDSFTFGHGVENDQTALAVLARTLGRRANVANYGVMAYGLEQMFLRLRAARNEIQPGDVVVFSPVSLDITRNLIAKEFVCFLHYKNYSKFETYPLWDGGAWRAARIADYCPRGDLPLALLQRFLLARHSQHEDALLAENADRIFRMAKGIADERGALFLLVFLVYPDECRRKAFDFDLSLLKTKFPTLMPYCLDDRAMARMRFATDGHLTPEGHRWTAMALLDILERTALSQDAPSAAQGKVPGSASQEPDGNRAQPR